ncbi:MAG: HEAT repeat domain-containing protein, partial [Planctomycetaceae bacterium]
STTDLDALTSRDPFQHQAAVWGLVQSDQLDDVVWDSLTDPRQRLGLLQAIRWKDAESPQPRREELIQNALHDRDPEVRLFAVRWIADARLTDWRDVLKRQLSSPITSPRLFQATLAAIEWLDRGQIQKLPKEPSYDHYLLEVLDDETAEPATLALALRLVSPDNERLTLDRLRKWIESDNPKLRREAVRTLAVRSGPERFPLLAHLAADNSQPEELRADAVMGLAGSASEHADLLRSLAESGPPPVRKEARRILRQTEKPVASTAPTASKADVDAWMSNHDGTGDRGAGWRVFFRAGGARCAACHRYEGRGSSVGPDLTLIGRQSNRRRIVESILQPSREIAPHFVPWIVVTADGRSRTGLPLGSEDGRTERFLQPDGTIFTVDR